MNRRKFATTAAAATIALGIPGCRTSKTENRVDIGTTSQTSARLPAKLDGSQVNFGARMLMVFMLAISQRDNSGGRLMDMFFPSDNSAPPDTVFTAGHIRKDLGVGESELRAFVQSLNTFLPGQNDAIKMRFDSVLTMFEAAFNYGKPDCPSQAALQAIIQTAGQQ